MAILSECCDTVLWRGLSEKVKNAAHVLKCRMVTELLAELSREQTTLQNADKNNGLAEQSIYVVIKI